MCGIVVGLCFGKLNKRDEEIRQRLLRYFSTELMIQTEDRGKDATGAAILFSDGDFCGIKRGEKVTEFLAKFGEGKDYYGSLLKVWRDIEINKSAKIFLGHCRQGTVGDKEENENNHPIKIGNLVGIHNGIIRNHDIIVEKLGCKRDGKVDSEAIFRLFEYYTNGGKEPFTTDMIQEIVNRLDGQFAITLFNADNLEQVPIFRDGRPVEFVLIKSIGLLLAVSEMKFWKEVHFHYERMVHYNPELFGRKLPSLLEKDNIVTKMMEDDSCYLFDLSKEVTDKTTIDDISEYKKMVRTNKMWQAPAGTNVRGSNTYSYNNNVCGHTTPALSAQKSSDKKRRVFDNITRQYVVKAGDKVIEDKAIVMGVTEDDEKESTQAVQSGSEDKVEGTVCEATTESDTSDTDVTEESPSEIPIEDSTSYDAEKDKVTIVREACKEIESKATECSVVEVEMSPTDPEIIEEAAKAYNNLSEKERGYETMDDILNDTNIQDIEVVQTLGEVLLCNRVRKAGWKAGYIAALKSMRKNKTSNFTSIQDIKAQRKERYLMNMKRMILILSKFYVDYTKGSDNLDYKVFLENRLSAAVINSGLTIDADDLLKMFNSHEQEVVKEASNVISTAQRQKI